MLDTASFRRAGWGVTVVICDTIGKNEATERVREIEDVPPNVQLKAPNLNSG